MADTAFDPVQLKIEHPIRDDSSQVLLRSRLRAVSRRMGFRDVVRERLEIVANELMSNQLKHAGGGFVQLWEVRMPQPALDLFALDYGPGIPNLQAALRAGHSTVGTLGRGLGSIDRLAHHAELFTVPDSGNSQWHGVAAWARFLPEGHTQQPDQVHPEVGMYLRAYQDRPANGDCVCLSKTEAGRLRWLHMDGLGHGEQAADAVSGLTDLVAGADPPATVMELLGRRLRGTRGAVAAFAEVDPVAREGTLLGVGDIAAYQVDNRSRHNFPFPPGVLGQTREAKAEQAAALDLAPGTTLVTASDGIRGRWEPTAFPGLFRLHPQLIAFFLGHLLGRANDDRSLFAVRVLDRPG
ncbi:hypothetical protein [Thiohalorhabdus sp.]|uniref:hypothetical protein n=1 Tax=Thiohalorhabdus sp. TaxID=3094134 RepID=UPI002FC36701